MIVPPSSRLSDHRCLNLVRQCPVPLHQRLCRERARAKELLLHMVRETQFVFGERFEPKMGFTHPGRRDVGSRRDGIERRSIAIVAHRVLEIPHVELEPCAVRCAPASKPEILVRPIPIATPDIQQHVVQVILQIEVHRQRGIPCSYRVQTLQGIEQRQVHRPANPLHELVPRVQIPRLHIAGIHRIPLRGRPSIVCRRKVLVGPLAEVVHPPVKSIQVHMHEPAVPSLLTHRSVQPPAKFIANELLGVSRRIPRIPIVRARPQDQRVKVPRRTHLPKEIVLQPTRSVFILEHHPQGMLVGDIPTSKVTPLDSQPRVDLELGRPIRIDPFHRHRPFPRDSSILRIGIDPPCRPK